MLMDVYFLLYIFLYAVYMISCFVFEVWERVRNEFQLFLYLSKGSCKECSEVVRKECIDKSSEFYL